MASCKDCLHYEVCRDLECEANLFSSCDRFKPTADYQKVRHGQIMWVNRLVAARYATATDEHGQKHHGKFHHRIENNPVGYCDQCEKKLDDNFMNFCPNCGAKMFGKGDE